MESSLRRKYTLIDKNDFAAISAVQKVSAAFCAAFPAGGLSRDLSRPRRPQGRSRGQRGHGVTGLEQRAEWSRRDACVGLTVSPEREQGYRERAGTGLRIQGLAGRPRD